MYRGTNCQYESPIILQVVGLVEGLLGERSPESRAQLLDDFLEEKEGKQRGEQSDSSEWSGVGNGLIHLAIY